MNCKTFQNEMAELLLDPVSTTSVASKAHLETCSRCRQEYASFVSTFQLLDRWTAPEPSLYFDQKLAVRLREEVASAPAGWFERLRSRLLFNTGRQFRPVLAGALAFALLVGGGTFAGISSMPSSHDKSSVSATVSDLQILDKNDQAIQQMDQLLQDDPADDSAGPPRS